MASVAAELLPPSSRVLKMAAYEARGESDEWYTPKYIFDALGDRFDLDVAAPAEGPRHVPCDTWYAEASLERPWFGYVWMNPPFGHQAEKRRWLAKFFGHGHGMALMPDRTSAPWFQEFAAHANALLWISPKVKFERADGSIGKSPGTGTVLMAAGERATKVILRARSLGIATLPVVDDKFVNAAPVTAAEVGLRRPCDRGALPHRSTQPAQTEA